MGIVYERIDAVPHTRRAEDSIDDRDEETKRRTLVFLESFGSTRDEKVNIRRAVRAWRKEVLQSAIEAAQDEVLNDDVGKAIEYWADELTVDDDGKLVELQNEIVSKTNELEEAKKALVNSEERLAEAVKKAKPDQMSSHRKHAIDLWKLSTAKLEEFASMLEGIQLDIEEASAKSETRSMRSCTKSGKPRWLTQASSLE